MTCSKCAGLMAPEHYLDPQHESTVSFIGYKCLNCGLVVDPVILRNRTLHGMRLAPASAGSVLLKERMVS